MKRRRFLQGLAAVALLPSLRWTGVDEKALKAAQVVQPAKYETYDLKDVGLDLVDVIYNIEPTSTPFFASMGRGTASQVRHEWIVDELT